MRGFDKAAPTHLLRRFIETAGLVQIEEGRIVMHLENQLSTKSLFRDHRRTHLLT